MKKACERCSCGSMKVHHGAGTRCERDPALPANVIEKYFLGRCPEYVGIVWKAIANGAVRALEDAGYRIVEPHRPKVTIWPPATDERGEE